MALLLKSMLSPKPFSPEQ